VILVSEKGMAPQMLRMFLGGGSKVVVMHNRITAEQRKLIGNKREQMPHWIGSVVADNLAGSYRLMDALYRQCTSAQPRVLGITGAPSTPVSQEREQGVRRFMEQAGRGRCLQTVNSDWSFKDGELKARLLLARYHQADILWAVNDSMALGALQACESLRLRPWIGGMGGAGRTPWSASARAAWPRRRPDISCSAPGPWPSGMTISTASTLPRTAPPKWCSIA